MNLKGKQSQILVGLLFSCLAFWLVLRQVDLAEVVSSFGKAHYALIGFAVIVQLLTLLLIAGRWRQLFQERPNWLGLFRALLVAQLFNVVLPVRLGLLVRVYLAGQKENLSKAIVLGSVLVEKVFDSLMFVLLFVVVIPFVAPHWFEWSAVPASTGLFLVLFPALVLMTLRRTWLLKLMKRILQYFPWEKHYSLSDKIKRVFDGLSFLRGLSKIFTVWGWTVLITILGALVNLIVMRAFDIHIPFMAAFFLLAVLQMGARVPAPLAGMGVFQYLCVEALSFFSVDPNLALSFGFMLHFVVFVPGSILGVLGLYQMRESLTTLKQEAEEQA